MRQQVREHPEQHLVQKGDHSANPTFHNTSTKIVTNHMHYKKAGTFSFLKSEGRLQSHYQLSHSVTREAEARPRSYSCVVSPRVCTMLVLINFCF